MAYWLSVFTGNTWEEFLAAGASTAGFPDNPRGPHRRMEPGDVLLCYVCGVSRWIGALEVTGEAYSDDTPIWSLIILPPDQAVPIKEIGPRLSYFRWAQGGSSWGAHFRKVPLEENSRDAQVVLEALHEAEQRPINRPVDPKLWMRKTRR
jgi:hypothetical protein